jgi:hypothetical protein
MHETVPIIKDRVAVDGERVAFLRTSAVFKYLVRMISIVAGNSRHFYQYLLAPMRSVPPLVYCTAHRWQD